MTTFEHSLLGVNGALASGLDRRYGWQIAALAGAAAAAPDWDGLAIMFSTSVLAQGHRVWGHNLHASVLLGVTLGALDYRFDVVTRLSRFFERLLRLDVPHERLQVRREFSRGALATWITVASLAALTQLPADMVVSGTATLADWEIKPLWPFSSRGYVFPMVPWGDPGISIVFIAGMFALVRWKERRQLVAAATLAGVVAYLVLRKFVFS
jgi:hypothetical protein